MKIDENTKVIGRFHTKPSPRGLNIYNPFFEEAGINAIYLLFYDSNPKVLVDGLKSLKLSGAVTVGFETDPEFAKLVNEHDESSTIVGRVGFIKNIDGKLRGYYQGGEGLFRATSSAVSLTDKNIVLVGSGNVAKSFLNSLSRNKTNPKSVTLCNRTTSKLDSIQKYPFIKSLVSLDKLQKLSGDVLINATDLGGSETDRVYTEEVVKNFGAISDVTFETEGTNLIKLAKKFNKAFSTGWDMFTYQGQVVLETILETEISAETLKKHVIKGLSQVVK